MYFHASQTPNIEVLEPHVSNHGKPLIYLSNKRENVLVYLSNAVEKYCRETNFAHDGIFRKWASYGFAKDGKLRLEEYYPNATQDTYQGVSGYIYDVDEPEGARQMQDVPDAVTVSGKVPVLGCEYIPDAYEAIMQAVKEEKIVLVRYEENSPQMLAWIERVMKEELEAEGAHPEYVHFLKGKFPFLKGGR